MTCLFRKILVCAAALLVSSAAVSAFADSVRTVTKTMKVGNFHGLDVAGSVDVTYTKGSGPMRVVGPESMVNRLKAKIEKGVLKLELSNASAFGIFNDGKVARKEKGKKVRITVSSTSLDEVEVSSGGIVNVKSGVKAADKFEVDASSGGVVNLGGVAASKCDVDLSSGAVVNIASANVGKMSVDASSGAVCNIQKITATTVNLDLSSGCVGELSGSCEILNVDVSGGAVGALKGLRAKTAKVDASGGAVLDYSAVKASVDKDISTVVKRHR